MRDWKKLESSERTPRIALARVFSHPMHLKAGTLRMTVAEYLEEWQVGFAWLAKQDSAGDMYPSANCAKKWETAKQLLCSRIKRWITKEMHVLEGWTFQCLINQSLLKL